MTGLAALVYSVGERADAVLHAAAAAFARDGLVVTGLLPYSLQRPGRSRCDMVLEDPRSGERIHISEDRGEMARGCRLDLGELLRAGQVLRRALDDRPDVVIVNKFGKSEAEGGGLRDVMADVVGAGIPLLVSVPRRNLAAWRTFAGDGATEIDLDVATDERAILESLRGALALPGDPPVAKS